MAVHIMNTSTWSMSTLGTSSSASATTASYFKINDPIFGLASKIDEDISTKDSLDIDGDVGDSDVKGDFFSCL